jgi:threonine dehydratase
VLTFEEIRAAAAYLDGSVVRTPTVASEALTMLVGRRVVLKLENLQRGGSFKVRGLAWRFASLDEAARAGGVVAVSGGNFGRAVADVARDAGVPATVVLPASAPRASIERIRAAGASVVVTETVECAFATAAQVVAEDNAVLLDDLADLTVAAGYGTLAAELIEDAPGVTDVVVSVGGGALLAGVCAAVAHLAPTVRVWGGEPVGAACMQAALGTGHPVVVPVTTDISTLGVPAVSQVILDEVRDRVAGVVTVEDEDSRSAARYLAEQAKVWAEPAAGCALAAAQTITTNLPTDAVVAIVVCGGNTTIADLAGDDDGPQGPET